MENLYIKTPNSKVYMSDTVKTLHLASNGPVWLLKWLLEMVLIAHFWSLTSLSKYDLQVLPHISMP